MVPVVTVQIFGVHPSGVSIASRRKSVQGDLSCGVRAWLSVKVGANPDNGVDRVRVQGARAQRAVLVTIWSISRGDTSLVVGVAAGGRGAGLPNRQVGGGPGPRLAGWRRANERGPVPAGRRARRARINCR
jgi:hypothetical protein